MDALRRHDVVAVARRIEGASYSRLRETTEREIRRRQLRIWPVAVRVGEILNRHLLESGTELILGSWVGACAEMAAGACLHAVASHLHVPEERFTQCARRLNVADELGQVGRSGHGNRAQIARQAGEI